MTQTSITSRQYRLGRTLADQVRAMRSAGQWCRSHSPSTELIVRATTSSARTSLQAGLAEPASHDGAPSYCDAPPVKCVGDQASELGQRTPSHTIGTVANITSSTATLAVRRTHHGRSTTTHDRRHGTIDDNAGETVRAIAALLHR